MLIQKMLSFNNLLNFECDGGRTFLELAAAIRATYKPKVLKLHVTHGIFSKGVACLNVHYDDIWCANYMGQKYENS